MPCSLLKRLISNEVFIGLANFKRIRRDGRHARLLSTPEHQDDTARPT